MASQHGMPTSFEHAAIALGHDFDRVATEQPAHDVHRVWEEEPLGPGVAAPCEHLGRHVDGVAQPGVGHHRRAEFAAVHVALRAHEERVPSGVKIHHQVPPRLRGGLDHREPVGDGGRQGLFDHHVLACAQHRDDGLAVQVVRRRDGHRLDVACRYVVQARRPRAAEPLAGAPRPGLVAIADDGYGAPRVCGQRERVVGAPDPGTDDADADGLVSHVEPPL